MQLFHLTDSDLLPMFLNRLRMGMEYIIPRSFEVSILGYDRRLPLQH